MDKYNKELIKTRKTNKEDKRQEIRKNMEKSSRLLDNYYNPKIHKKNWEPSGKVSERNKYTYGDTGLGFNLKDIKVTQNEKTAKLANTQTHFLEFDFLENNDIIITIEHCARCEEHLNHTNHYNDIYKNIAKLLQLCINIRFPFIKVHLKPIDPSNKKQNLLGAFEVQLGMKINDQLSIILLFSKLKTNQWPNFHNILNKINDLVPALNIKCTVYDKEEGVDSEISGIDNYNSSNFMSVTNNNIDNKSLLALPSKYENIKINLYSFRSEQIELYCKEAFDQLDLIYNPKRKVEIYYEEQNSKTNNNNIMNKTNIDNNKSNMTQKTYFSRPQSDTSLYNFNSSKKNSSFSFLNQIKRGEVIEDTGLVERLKGKLLSSGYTDKSGNLSFENVPYDSYLIEVENNKSFLSCGMLLQFQKIFNVSSNKSTDGRYNLNKIFGLRRQVDSFVEVFLFSKGKNNQNDQNDITGINLIDGATVTLIKKFFDSGDGGNMDEFSLTENKNIKGRYEIITVPGDAELNVMKNGYETITKDIHLRAGINKINIELV